MLKQLNAQIDLSNGLITTPSSTNKILFKPNLSSGLHIIKANCKQILKLPTDIQDNDIILPEIKIQNKFIIPSGVYTARNWHIQAPVINLTNTDQKFLIDQPLKVDLFHHDIIECNLKQTYENEQQYVSIDKLIRTDHLNNEEKQSIIHLCKKYEDVFFREGDNLSFTNKIKHEIKTTDDLPIYTKSYRYPHIHKNEVNTQIEKMLKQGIIKPSYSPWSSPIWIVPKKADASGLRKWRLVVDYRKLNDKTIGDKYPIPNITDILDKLGKCMYFTTLDLASGFHQIEVHPRDIEKTAFSVDHGHYEYVRMPFGLKNAPSTFQRVMDNVLKDLQGTVCLVYMDDIIIFSTSLQEHILNLDKVFSKLRDANLKVQLDKCEFLRREIAFLGHIISETGLKPNPDKIIAIQNFPIPKTQKDIKSFLGLLGYYRKFIKDFSQLTKPLTSCLKKGATVKHTPQFIKCFETCKDLLTNDPILAYPDFNKEFILTTDASNVALGAVLSQGPIGKDHPICYASRTLTDSEQNYSTIEKELLAIVWATKYFRPYLYGRKFTIVTDHQPLRWLMSLKEPNSKLVRWRLKLEEFDYTIIHKPGKYNTNADALSRAIIETNIHDTSSSNTSTNTVHSATEDNTSLIRISENPLNDFRNQLIIYKPENILNATKRKLEILFNKRRRITLNISSDDDDSLISLIKEYIPTKSLLALYCPNDELFLKIQNVYSLYFSQGKQYKIIRTTKLLKDVLSDDEQDEIIKKYHDFRHTGINETFTHLRREYYFPNLKSKITYYINNCKLCNENKYDRKPPKQNFELTETPSQPLEIIHMDIFYLDSAKFLTIIDKFSRFGQAYEIQTRNSNHIIEALAQYIAHYGQPKTIVVDSEKGFDSIRFRQFCENYNINIHITSVRSSNSNSPVERFHSTILEKYRITHSSDKSATPEIKMLHTIFVYNNSIHSTINCTPFELFFGRKYDIQLTPDADYVRQEREKFQTQSFEKQRQEKEKFIQTINNNRETPHDYKENELTYFRENEHNNKLHPKFKQVKIRQNNKVTITDDKNRKIPKCKLKRPYVLQDVICNNDNDEDTENGNTRLDEQPGTSGYSIRNSTNK